MKKVLILSLAFIYLGLLSSSSVQAQDTETIKWYSWEEAISLMEKEPKKIFIDVYTDWCGWCKRMDRSTFTEANVASYLNKNFYPVKFDAEQKKTINYNGHDLNYVASGRRGVHELAYALLDGRLSYPAFVYLDENQARITISPGYKTPDVLITELKFIGDNHYKEKTWDQYSKGE